VRTASIFLVVALAGTACSSHSDKAQGQAHIACTALIKNTGPMSASMPEVVGHLTKAAALDRQRFAGMLRIAVVLQAELDAGRRPGSTVNPSRPANELEARCQPFL
jgi:hypothetical protein